MMPSVSRLVLATSAALALGACEREKVEVYTAPKDQPVAETHSPDDGHDHSHPAHAQGATAQAQAPARPQFPKLSWTLPAGWEESAGRQMSAATFLIKSDKGDANVTITPLADLAGQEALLVNMWRQQVGQEPLSGEDVQKTLSEIDVAGGKGQVFEVTGTPDGKPMRIVTAMQHGISGASWFYKLSGDEAVVNAQKPAFLEFVKSVRFLENKESTPAQATATAQAPQPAPQEPAAAQPQTASAPATTPAATPAPAPAAPPPATAAAPVPAPALAPAPTSQPQFPPDEPAPQFKWTVPEGWQTLQAGQMQVAKFSVPEQNGAKAEVAVSIFPSDTGGTLANVNRWLGQIGQPPVDEARLGEFVKPLDGAPEGSQLVDLSGETKRIVGAIVPRDGRYWFYKMMGDAAAVNAAKDAFVSFSKAQP